MNERGLPISIKMHGRHELLAGAASYEVGSREKHYPAMIRAGEIRSADADRDLAAWRAIANLFDKAYAWVEDWNELVDAGDRAVTSRDEACAAKPGSAYLISRRARVRWIRDMLVYHRGFYARVREPLPPYPLIPFEVRD